LAVSINLINIHDTFLRYACSLLRQGMKQITITLETADIIALEKGSGKAAVAKVRKGPIIMLLPNTRICIDLQKKSDQNSGAHSCAAALFQASKDNVVQQINEGGKTHKCILW
jgi:hypothetical protein